MTGLGRPALTRVSMACALVALLSIVGAAIVFATSDSWLLPHRLLRPANLTLVAGLVATLVLLVQGLARRSMSASLVSLVLLLALGALWMTGESTPAPVKRVTGPDGRVAVVHELGGTILDPLWEVSLETGGGWGARRSVLGCVDGDYEDFQSVRWQDASTLLLDVGNGNPRTVDVSGATIPRPGLVSCQR